MADDIREISTRIAMLERQAESLKMNIEMLQTHIRELIMAKETIENIKKADKDQQILFPIGGGGYSYGKLTDGQNVIINIGSSIAVRKDIDEAVSIMGERLDEMKNLLNRTSASYGEVARAMADLEQKGRQIMQQQQPKSKA